jgi:transcription antitermination factor NusG
VGWVLIVTQTNAEQGVIAKLAQMQLAHHLFLVRRNVVVAGKVTERLAPAFPHYVFVKPEDRWRDIREVNGVINFVSFGKDCVAEVVPDKTIVALVAATEGDIFPGTAISSRFHRGDRIRICGANPFWGCEGTYSHALGNMRAVVLIEAMGRKVPLPLDERDIELVVKCNRRKRRRRRGKFVGAPYVSS